MDQDTAALNQIDLVHGQAHWVLRHFYMSAPDTDESFNALLKSLRVGGVPFSPEELGSGIGRNVRYGYEHIMELALALAFRTQGVLPRYFVSVIAKNREVLRRYFRQAYLERESGLGARVAFYDAPPDRDSNSASKPSSVPFALMSGTYLSLSFIDVRGGVQMPLDFNLVGPKDAVLLFSRGHLNLYPRPPLALSDMAVDIVKLATSRQLPQIKRGRQ